MLELDVEQRRKLALSTRKNRQSTSSSKKTSTPPMNLMTMMLKYGRRLHSSLPVTTLICSLRSRSISKPSVSTVSSQTLTSRLSSMLHLLKPKQFTLTTSESLMRFKRNKKQSWLLSRSNSWQRQRLKQSSTVPHNWKKPRRKPLLLAPSKFSLLRSLKRLNQRRRTKRRPSHAVSISPIRTSLPRSWTLRSSTWDTSRPGRHFSIHGSIWLLQRSDASYVTIFGPVTLKAVCFQLSRPSITSILLYEGSLK